MTQNCLFCNMATGKLATNKVYEDDHIFVINDIRPKARVHLLVIPKIHIASLLDVQEEHSDLMGYIVTSLKNFAKEQNIDSFRTVINAGAGSGQEIFHLHFHLLGGGALPKF
ncbi:MAG: HIT domain-containing protein [Candidatus Berkiella sp.]